MLRAEFHHTRIVQNTHTMFFKSLGEGLARLTPSPELTKKNIYIYMVGVGSTWGINDTANMSHPPL